MNLTLWMAFSSSKGYFFLMAAGTSLRVSSMDDTAAFTSRLAAPAAAAVPLQPVRPVAATNRRRESVGERWPGGGEATGAGGTFSVAPTLAAFNLAKLRFNFLHVFICFCFIAESANSCSGTLMSNIFGSALMNTVRIQDGILCVLGCL